jgi:hypothetical protein
MFGSLTSSMIVLDSLIYRLPSGFYPFEEGEEYKALLDGTHDAREERDSMETFAPLVPSQLGKRNQRCKQDSTSFLMRSFLMRMMSENTSILSVVSTQSHFLLVKILLVKLFLL